MLGAAESTVQDKYVESPACDYDEGKYLLLR